MKAVPLPGAQGRALRRAVGCLALFGLAAGLVLSAGRPAGAQEKEKAGPGRPQDVYAQIRALMGEGKYDIAAVFLQSFLDSNPTDKDLLDIEARYGSTTFLQLRTIPKWSDDPKLDQQARANVDAIIAKATAATEKVLRNPARVTKYVRNLGETPEEREFAVAELRRTGDYAVPFMVDALRTNLNPAVSAGIVGAIPSLDAPSMAGWVAALDGLPQEQQYGVLAGIASRPDVLSLLTKAQTNFTPVLWRIVGDPNASPALQAYARELLGKLVTGSAKRSPEAELVAAARPFADRKAVYMGSAPNPNGTPTAVPVWTWDATAKKLVKNDAVPSVDADQYFALRYARWALEQRPDYEPAQVMVLTVATEHAMDLGKFGDLARSDPVVYRMLADTPTSVLTDLLGRAIAEKRTGLVLALTQALGVRADKEPAVPTTAGRPSLLERALDYPDPRVQLAAANALLRAAVPVDPKLRGRVIEVLKRAAATDPGAPPAPKGTALLADPDRRRADDTANLLRGLGYGVERFATGRDLLRRVSKASDFDLILIDHHVPYPELLDVVSALRADVNVARRPILVSASPDHPTPPTLDQMVLRFALLIAATDTAPHQVPPPENEADPDYMPPPYVPDFKRTLTNEQREAERQTLAGIRDQVFARAAKARMDRLQRVIATTGLELTTDQKFQLGLRVEQITYAVLGAQFPLTPESSPATYQHVLGLQKQIGIQPYVAPYTRRVGVDHLMTLAGRLEADVGAAKHAVDRYEALRTRVDADVLGLRVETMRNPAAEARIARMLQHFAAVRVIPEPTTRTWLEADINAAFADPADRPRDPAEKAAGARLAVGWLAKMATGEVAGFDARPAAPELIAALRSDDTAGLAVDAVARFPTADAQLGLITLVLTNGRPVPLRIRAADAAIRHIQQNGKLVPQTLITEAAAQMRTEQDPDLRGKLMILKGLLLPDAKGYVTELRNYTPPLVTPPPMPAMPPAADPKAKEPEPKGKEPEPKP